VPDAEKTASELPVKAYQNETQAEYFNRLLQARRLSAAEIARRGAVIAEQTGQRKLAVGHQAVSQWVKGTRNPSPEHRALLACILEVPASEINSACDAEIARLFATSVIRTARVHVDSRYRSFEYNATIKPGIDLSKPAVYRRWSDIFSIWPNLLARHLKNVHYELFGWIPDQSASPIIAQPMCMVPLVEPTKGLSSVLDTATSSQRYVWFVYVPGGALDVGIGYRESRTFVLVKNTGTGIHAQRYLFSRIELVGYFSGRTLFRIAKRDTQSDAAVSP
jgi:transcriptional regulator with XRE-family HTH domain